MNAIRPLWDTMPLTPEAGKTPAGQKRDDLFTDIFRSAVENVKATDQQAVELEYLMSTGQLDNPAELTIALYKNSVSVNLLTTLRDKALDAYNEIMRISL